MFFAAKEVTVLKHKRCVKWEVSHGVLQVLSDAKKQENASRDMPVPQGT